ERSSSRTGRPGTPLTPDQKGISSHPDDYKIGYALAEPFQDRGSGRRGRAWARTIARASKNWPRLTSVNCRRRVWRPSAGTWKTALVAKRFWTAWTAGPTRPSPPCVIPDRPGTLVASMRSPVRKGTVPFLWGDRPLSLGGPSPFFPAADLP